VLPGAFRNRDLWLLRYCNATELEPGRGGNAGARLADFSSDRKSPTAPRCVSLSGLAIELMLVI